MARFRQEIAATYFFFPKKHIPNNTFLISFIFIGIRALNNTKLAIQCKDYANMFIYKIYVREKKEKD